jgi:flagellar hook-associated protein 1 FlgK
MSSFSTLRLAGSALRTHRHAMDVVGQNVANAATEGYSRQRAELVSVGQPAAPALWSRAVGATLGGVEVADVTRIRDAFLEARGRAEHARAEYTTQRASSLANVDQMLGEPGDNGLTAALGDMWAAWHDVANRPTDPAARSQVLQRTGIAVDTLSGLYDRLDVQWNDEREQLGTVLSEVNAAAASIADLNASIQRASLAGAEVNELADRRDLLAMRVAELVGARVVDGADGAVDVYLGSTALVSGITSRALEPGGSTTFAGVGGDPVSVVWADDPQTAAAVTDGQGAALLESLNVDLRNHGLALDGVAAALVSSVNTLQTAGWDQDGNLGVALLAGSTAADISVAITDPRKLAASSSAGGNAGGDNAQLLADLAASATGADSKYRTFVVGLGAATQAATRRAEIQSDLTAAADGARDSVAGVNLDEEMTDLIMYQRAYESAARVLTIVDGLLDTLINRTGVG